MPVTEKTISVQGDVFRSTATTKRASVASFGPSVTVDEETTVGDTVPTATTDLSVSIGNLTTVTAITILLDDQLDGTLKFKFNGSLTAMPVEQMLILMGTAITSITVTNDSGNTAAFIAYMAGE